MNTRWNEAKLYHSGDEFFAEAVSCIRRAKETVSLESYIFEMDFIADILLVEMQLASLRGCKVRLLVDGVGSFFWTDTIRKRCAQEGIEFRVYHPVPGIFQWGAMSSQVFKLMNRRNHRKTLLIDGKLALLGSFNVTQVHSERISGPKTWRDSGVRLEGEALESLNAAFDLAWNFSKNIPRFALDSKWVKDKVFLVKKWQNLLRLNVNAKIRRLLYRDLCRRILQAQEKVYIATAYFIPKRALLKALAKAAQKGVDVRVLIPGPTDVPFVKWAAHRLPYELSKYGVKVFEYQPRILHAKYMIIDDWGSIGSFNLNHRSLLHDLEVEAVLTDEESLKNLTHQFREDLLHSLAFNMTYYERRSWWQRWISKTLFKLRHWF